MPAQNLVNYINPFSQIYTYISNTYFLDVSFWRDISDFICFLVRADQCYQPVMIMA